MRQLTQAMIDGAGDQRRPLRLFPGDYSVSATLSLKCRSGLFIRGAGDMDNASYGAGWPEMAYTRLVWDGPRGQTMFDGTSALGCGFRDVILDGAASAGIGIGCWTVPGWPNSRTRLGNVMLRNFTSCGVQFGTPGEPSGWNCDMSEFYSVGVAGCPVGIQTCNDQSVGHLWEKIGNVDCPVGIDLVRGGNVQIRGAWQDGGNPRTFLRLGAGGCNVCTVLISGGHLERGCLVDASDAPEWALWQVAIESYLATVPEPDDVPLTKLSQISQSRGAKIIATGCWLNGRATA